ncbi:hypothetical protein T439DRAFT_360509 [Meredithblackwellia eburnea MCA 4105]
MASTKVQQPVPEPPIRRGLTSIDKSLFETEIPVVAARIPLKQTTELSRNELKKVVLRIPRIQSIVADDESSELKKVLFYTHDKTQLPAEVLQLLADKQIDMVDHKIKLGYDYWTADQILQSVLPEDLLDESPTSFTQIGHIAHLNLRDEYLPHRLLIGQVILDKNKAIRTVVNKLDTIDNTFRNFKMEVLAGEEDFVAQISESNCTFRFDFSQVYWNSRLQGEHQRLVETFSPNEVVVDAFAGVGPFAVPAGKKGCAVLASDLNPSSAEALRGNVELNKVQHNVRTGNADARDWICQSVLSIWKQPFPAYMPPITSRARGRAAHEALKQAKADPTFTATSSTPPPPPPPAPAPEPEGPARNLVDHFVMNLPVSTIEFLDAFRGIYRPLF